MKTRRERIRREQAGLQSSPFQHLPNITQRRGRAPTPAVETNEIGNSNQKIPDALAAALHSEDPAPTRSNTSEGGFPNPSYSTTSGNGVANMFHPMISESPNPRTAPSAVANSPFVNTAGPKEQFSLIYVLENPSSEELASLRPVNIDSLISLVTRTDRIPDLMSWIKGRGEPCGTGRRTNSSVSTQVSPALKNRSLSDQMEISTQYAQPHPTEPLAGQEMSDRAEETDLDIEIITDSTPATHGSLECCTPPSQILEAAKLPNEETELDTDMQPAGAEQIEPVDQEMSDSTEEIESEIHRVTYTTPATLGRPLDSRSLPIQNLKAAKRPNAKIPHNDKVRTTTVYEKVDRYTKYGSAQYGLKAVTYTSAEAVPPHQVLLSKDFAKRIAENLLSKQLNRATSAEYDSDSESASDCGSIQSGSFCAGIPVIEPSVQAPQPALQPVPQSLRSPWRIGGWIRSSAHSMRKFIPGFNLLSPVPEQSPASLRTAPVSPNAIKDRRRRSKDLSSRSKKSFRTREHVQSVRTKHVERAAARAQVKAAKEEEDRKAKALKEGQRKSEMATNPGQKRKRVPSPDTIPNPKGCSFGLDLDYFGYDSSDEDEEPVITPSKQPNKVRRTSGPELVIQLPYKARTYPPTIPRSRLFAKDDLLEEERKKHGFWPPPPPTPRSWDVPPLTPIYPAVKYTVPSTTERDSKLNFSGTKVSLQVEKGVSRTRVSNHRKENDSVGRVECPSPAKITTPVANAASALMRKANSSKCTSPTLLPSAAISLQSGPLSGPSQTTQAETLRKARYNALKNKPRTPSSLGRKSFSPVEAHSEAKTQPTVNNLSFPEPSNATNAASMIRRTEECKKFDASEEFLKTADKKVYAILANVHVDPTGAGKTFTEAVTKSATAKNTDATGEPDASSPLSTSMTM